MTSFSARLHLSPTDPSTKDESEQSPLSFPPGRIGFETLRRLLAPVRVDLCFLHKILLYRVTATTTGRFIKITSSTTMISRTFALLAAAASVGSTAAFTASPIARASTQLSMVSLARGVEKRRGGGDDPEASAPSLEGRRPSSAWKGGATMH